MKEKIYLYIVIILLAAFSANTYWQMIKTQTRVSMLETQESSRHEINQNVDAKITEIKLKQENLKITITDIISKQNSILTWANNINDDVASLDESVKKINNTEAILTHSIHEIQNEKVIYRIDMLENRVDSLKQQIPKETLPKPTLESPKVDINKLNSLEDRVKKIEYSIWGISGVPTVMFEGAIQDQINALKRNTRNNY